MKKYLIEGVERLNNSVNGNPRYKLYLYDENAGEGMSHFITAKTASDYSFVYGTNFDKGKNILADIDYTRSGNAVVRNAKNIKEEAAVK